MRLDVYAKDEKNTRYNIEMQVLKQSALGRRSRYYQSQMDMEPVSYTHLEKELSFDDYFIEFANGTDMKRVGMSEDCFVTGKDEAFTLDDKQRLHLHHDMFDDDAIILKDVPSKMTLASEKGNARIEMETNNLGYLGIWHKPASDAPYVCIEPWSSLPARKDVIEDLEKQDNLVSLKPDGYYTGFFKVKIVK